MTQEPLSPDQQAVRQLLGEARHEAPMPPEVVARLDETLASLVAERSPADVAAAVAPVVDLAARRRRRRASLVLAAAAVVVAGVAGPRMMQGGGDSASVDAGADSSFGGSALVEEDSPEQAPSPGATTDDLQRDTGGEAYTARDRLAAVSSDTAARDLRRVRDRREVRAQATGPLTAEEVACAGGADAVRDRLVVPITWDGVPAVASFAAPRDGRQLVEVTTCEGDGPVTAVWLTAR
ncbi:MAG: hypothetical protein LT071_06395 [Nocardioides sp.]|nr:hypothetical protein [Nocardioides sp.]